jgi:8-oxo-dGTP pyrophosphatase MutT (NUDIX family)
MTGTGAESSIIVLATEPLGLNVSLHFDSEEVFLPPDWLKPAYHAAVLEWQRKLSYDSGRARPSSVTVTAAGVRLSGGPFLYSETRALEQCVLAHRAGQFGTALLDESAMVPSASVVVSVLTDEGYLLLPRRSDTLVTLNGMWAAGLGEGLEPVDFLSCRPHEAVLRALSEELAIEKSTVPEAAVRILAVLQNADTLSTMIFCVVDLSGAGAYFSAARVIARAATAKDAWEHSEFRVIKPALSSFNEVLSGSAYGVCPGARTCISILESYRNRRS